MALTLMTNFSLIGKTRFIPAFSIVRYLKFQLKFSHFNFCISAKFKPNSKINKAKNCPGQVKGP